MKLYLVKKTYLFVAVISICLISCGEKPNQINTEDNVDNHINSVDSIEHKKDYELAEDFHRGLMDAEVDTIIFYKRTCIGCCDYYNIFWAKNGERKLNKFYFDFNDMKTNSVEMEISNNRIFNAVYDNYNELKNSPIKENIHKRLDGTSTISMIDHYCYTQLKIYLNQDSLIADRIKDHSFDEYTGFNEVANDKSETNDSYSENNDSKWNELLTIIESELAIMEGTSEREIETLRTIKNKSY